MSLNLFVNEINTDTIRSAAEGGTYTINYSLLTINYIPSGGERRYDEMPVSGGRQKGEGTRVSG